MALSERQKQYLHMMGIEPWVLREQRPADRHQSEQSAATATIESGDIALPPASFEQSQPISKPGSATIGESVSSMDWEMLQHTVSQCRRCDLHQTRTQTVFGVGNRQAQWLVIGEAPGADEDRQGEPFVGRAGQLLNNMLHAIGLNRQDVYIANILKCRPPNNRDPKPEEVAHCEAYLHRQVALIQPQIILAVGRIAAHNLLKTDMSLSKLRQQTFRYADTQIPLIVTYHPAYLLRSPREKRKAWQDLQYAVRVFNQQA